MWHPEKTRILFAPDGAAGAGAGTGDGAGSGGQSGAGGAGQGAGAGGAGGGAPWYEGKVAPEALQFYQRKQYDLSDPMKLIEGLTRGYQGAEKLLGVPAERMLRIPLPNADTSEISQYWQQIGVPKEAKDYDLSAVKFGDGTELDQAFADMIRGSMHRNRVPKDYAANVVKDIVTFMEGADKADLADRTAAIQEQTQALDRDWGNNKAAYLVVARGALEALGKAAGLNADQIKQGWDAISEIGGIGSSFAMKMLFEAGRRMGEDRFIGGGQGLGRGDTMSRDAARAEIEALKSDKEFGRRLLAGGREERKKWDDLHKVAFPAPQAA